MRKVVLLMTGFMFASIAHAAINWEVYSDATMGPGDNYGFVDVYDTPPDNTTLEVTGGSAYIVAHDQSTVDIFGGGISNLDNNDLSTSNIYGGQIYGEIWARNQSTVNITNGLVNWVNGFDQSLIDISGGDIFALKAIGDSEINISGGQITERIIAEEYSTINFYGYGFNYNPTGGEWNGGQLTGFWSDDTPFSIDLNNWDDITFEHVNLYTIPEPTTLLLFGLGGLLLRRRA
jgi:hypothetical protein